MLVLADRLGLILQFLAFWMLAPEVLGNTRLHKIKEATTRVVQAFLFIPVGAGIVFVLAGLLLRQLDEDLHSILRASIVAAIFLVVSLLGYLAIRKDVLHRLLGRLEDDSGFRSVLASLGALAFTIGFVLQFVASGK